MFDAETKRLCNVMSDGVQNIRTFDPIQASLMQPGSKVESNEGYGASVPFAVRMQRLFLVRRRLGSKWRNTRRQPAVHSPEPGDSWRQRSLILQLGDRLGS